MGYELQPAEAFRASTALGVSAEVEGVSVRVGNRRFAEEETPIDAAVETEAGRLDNAGRTVVYVAIAGKLAGLLGVGDAVKPNAARAVATLKRQGLRVVMMTGDSQAAADTAASGAGIDEVHAQARPEDKLALVRALQSQGFSVAMVGDGINDAAALAQADVGIAMSTGADVAIEAADITLLHGDVSRIAEAISLSRSTLATIRQNLVWAFGYNVVAIPIAALGLLNPIIAGGAMAFSSVSVMLNSLRLRSQGRGIADESGNPFAGGQRGFISANRAPLLAVASAVAVLVVPLVVFTAIDRGWFQSGESLPAGTVAVSLTNFRITPSAPVQAGTVTLRVEHDDAGHAHGGDTAGQQHDLLVYRDDPAGVRTLVARTRELGPGERQDLPVDFTPGTYELECDIVEIVDGKAFSHLAEGMHRTITIQ
jgi:Cu+-exporting ATPase